ncbi:MAG TPA: hypothetical protein VGN01_12850 [Acidobacteriaceae bacterium]|jgi:hypothetical protein
MMHSFLVGAVYVALVITPCVIALVSARHTEEPQDTSLARHDIAV